jgi:hypothetical protein
MPNVTGTVVLGTERNEPPGIVTVAPLSPTPVTEPAPNGLVKVAYKTPPIYKSRLAEVWPIWLLAF